MKQLSGGGTDERLTRELYVGGLPVGITAPVLMEFLEQAMNKYSLTDTEGKCVIRASLSGDGSYAFVEFRTVEETDKCITALNGLPMMGNPIKIGRPTNYTGTGPTTGSFNPNLPALPPLNIEPVSNVLMCVRKVICIVIIGSS